jgi:hypothetical protein
MGFENANVFFLLLISCSSVAEIQHQLETAYLRFAGLNKCK